MFQPCPGCGRAHAYVLEPGAVEPTKAKPAAAPPPDPPPGPPPDLVRQLAAARAALAAVHASTSWRLTRPLRRMARIAGRS